MIRTIGRTALGLAALAVLFAPATAQAETIRFDQLEQGGTLTNTAGDIVGSNIIFEFITFDGDDNGTPEQLAFCSDDGFTGSTNCYLNFEYDPANSVNFFELTAPSGLFDAGGTQFAAAGEVVLSGSFTSAPVFTLGGTNFNGVGLDTKSQALLDFFQAVTPAANFKFNNTEIRTTSTGTVTQADIINTSVPEPGLLALFGLGLLGVGRRLARRHN